MQIYGLEFFVVCHHPYKSFDHKLCVSGDIMFLIRHMTSREHRFKGLCEFTGETPSQRVTTLPFLVAIGVVQVEIRSI